MKMSKLRNHLKRTRRSTDGFSDLVGEFRRRVTKESRTLTNVRDAAGFESHQPRAGPVGSNRVVCEHNLSQRTRAAVKRAVAFHRHNAVCDNEVNRNCGTSIEDALLNALPVENILRPSVSR